MKLTRNNHFILYQGLIGIFVS